MDSLFDHVGHSAAVIPVSHGDSSSLHQEYLLTENGALSPIASASGHGADSGTMGSNSASAPLPTLVAISGSNLQIDLVWDLSVTSAPAGFTSAVIAAAQNYVNDFTASTKTVLYIAVGWGEIAGSSMAANALGESESAGYLTNYATVANAMSRAGDVLHALNEPTHGQFFVTSAEAKALGLVSGTSGSMTSVDGYIGFSTLTGTGYSWNFEASGTTASQFNLQAVVDHEISEVMGRIGMEGTVVYNGHKTYTPLDLLDFSSPGVLALSANGGYFSTDNGSTHMGNFNNASKFGGDISDWASYLSVSQSGTLTSGSDAFNAFDYPGYDATLSADDLLELTALGYKLTPTGKNLA